MIIFKADISLEALELLIEMFHITMLGRTIDNHIAAHTGKELSIHSDVWERNEGKRTCNLQHW